MDPTYPISEGLRRRALEASGVAQRHDEEEQLTDWRFGQLTSAGCDDHHAQLLARRHDIDLHRAVEILERGCPPVTAAAILL